MNTHTHTTLVPSTSIRMRHSILTMCSLSRWNPPLESFNNWMWRTSTYNAFNNKSNRKGAGSSGCIQATIKKRLTDLSRRSISNSEWETRQHSSATRNAIIWSSPYDQYVSKTKRIKVLHHADVMKRNNQQNKTKMLGCSPWIWQATSVNKLTLFSPFSFRYLDGEQLGRADSWKNTFYGKSCWRQRGQPERNN